MITPQILPANPDPAPDRRVELIAQELNNYWTDLENGRPSYPDDIDYNMAHNVLARLELEGYVRAEFLAEWERELVGA